MNVLSSYSTKICLKQNLYRKVRTADFFIVTCLVFSYRNIKIETEDNHVSWVQCLKYMAP
jgi:hypothetical protein